MARERTFTFHCTLIARKNGYKVEPSQELVALGKGLHDHKHCLIQHCM
jgi:hypothetical protein